MTVRAAALMIAGLTSGHALAADARFVIKSERVAEPSELQQVEPAVKLSAAMSETSPSQDISNPLRAAQLVPPQNVPAPNVPPQSVPPQNPPLEVEPPVIPPQPTTIVPAPGSEPAAGPLLDGDLPAEELIPPVVVDSEGEGGRGRGVQPYGGGHPTDWSWGCGGSPYRTVGMCDDWKVGCRWHVTVDGMVMSREETDLPGLIAAMPGSFVVSSPLTPAGIVGTPSTEQFDYGPGGRITFTSQVERCTGWDMMCVYEGIEDWNASVVYPVQPFEPEFFTPVITETTTTDPVTGGTTTTFTYARGPLPLQPLPPFPDGFEQRSLHYTSSLHSAEMNFLRRCGGACRPYCGFRYIKFADSITDVLDQDGQFPLPFAGPAPPDEIAPGQFLGMAETDRLNLFDIDNNLFGFQIGLLQDTLRLNKRLSIEGVVNAGVFYNKVKYFNRQQVETTQFIADDLSTTGFDESRIDVSTATNDDARDLSEISYSSEATLSAVCRLNKCWALRGGYQVLWIANIQQADAAYLGDENTTNDLLFHGWHAGIECRR
jgi:hypothetical protein